MSHQRNNNLISDEVFYHTKAYISRLSVFRWVCHFYYYIQNKSKLIFSKNTKDRIFLDFSELLAIIQL
jgi:hypothetical protein